MASTGVLLLGFGGPDSLDAVRPFMCNLMDREPSDQLVESVCRRYLAIGGSSPLPQIAADIAAGLETRLAENGTPVPVRIGMRYWHPFIEDSIAELVDLGRDRIVTVSLSPFESKAASGAYREAIDAVAGTYPGLEIVEAPLVSELDSFIDFMAGGAAVAIEDVEPNEGAILAFTAHSLPESDLEVDDPYVIGLQKTAQAVAEKLGMALGHPDAGNPLFSEFTAYGTAAAPRAWFLVYQSKGQRPGAWLEPDLDELIDAVAASQASSIVVVPIGFLTDHMETLYDLDIVAADRALTAGVEWMRAPVVNDAEVVLDEIAEMVGNLL
jgi:ferrochelatase